MNITKVFKILLKIFPVIEILALIIVLGITGFIPGILLLVASAFLGKTLLQPGSLINLRLLQQRLLFGERPTFDELDAGMMTVAACLLIVPGFISSIVGLLLLSSRLRRWVLGWMIKHQVISPDQSAKSSPNQRVIEGEFWRED